MTRDRAMPIAAVRVTATAPRYHYHSLAAYSYFMVNHWNRSLVPAVL